MGTTLRIKTKKSKWIILSSPPPFALSLLSPQPTCRHHPLLYKWEMHDPQTASVLTLVLLIFLIPLVLLTKSIASLVVAPLKSSTDAFLCLPSSVWLSRNLVLLSLDL